MIQLHKRCDVQAAVGLVEGVSVGTGLSAEQRLERIFSLFRGDASEVHDVTPSRWT